MIRKLILTLVVLGGFGAIGGYYLKQQYPEVTRYVLGEAHPAMLLNDQSLVTDDMVMLSHIDQNVLGVFAPQAQSSALEQIQRYGNDGLRAVLPHLGTANQQINFWTFSTYVAQGALAFRTMSIAHGRFDVQALERSLSTDYELYARYIDDIALFDLDLGDQACDEKLWSVYLSTEQTIVASPELMDRMLPQIIGRQHAGVPLQEWDEFTRSKLASVWIKRPSGLSHEQQTDLNDLVNVYAPGVESLFLGVGFNIVEQQGVFSLQGKAKGERYASFAMAKWKSSLSQNKDRLQLKLPELYPFLSSVLVKSEKENIVGHLAIDQNDVTKLPNKFPEFVGYIAKQHAEVRQKGHSSFSSAFHIEEAEDKARAYFANVTHNKLSTYDETRLGGVDVSNGPFGLRIDKVRLNETGHLQLSLSVGGEVLNIGDQGARVFFSLLELTDNSASNLLPSPHCEKITHKTLASPFEVQKGNLIHAVQTIELGLRAAERDLKTLKGKVALNLPESVKRQRITLPKKYPHDLKINEETVLTLRKLDGKQLHYTVAGRVIDLLEVRGLNANNEILPQEKVQQEAVYSKQGVIDRMIGQRVYRDKPAKLELVIGEGELLKDYPLTLNFAELKKEHNKVTTVPEPKLSLSGASKLAANPADCETQTVQAGPICLTLVKPRVQGEAYKLKLEASTNDYLQNNLSRTGILLNKMGNNELNTMLWPVYGIEKERSRLTAELLLPNIERGSKLPLTGKLMVYEPNDFQTISIRHVHVGKQVNENGIEIQLIEKTRAGGYVFKVGQGGERILQFIGRNSLITPVETKVIRIVQQKDDVLYELEAKGAARFDVVAAKQQRELEFNFYITN